MINIRSSNGTLTADTITGDVIKCDMDGEGIDAIKKFDLEEFCKHYGYSKETMPIDIDILDLGYWYVSIKGILEYEEPAHDWREEFKVLRTQE